MTPELPFPPGRNHSNQSNKKRGQLLSELEIAEISLVDRPANRGAVVVLYKRDTSQPTRKENTMPTSLTEVLKGQAHTRESVVKIVEGSAVDIAKRLGVSLDRARIRAWTPEAIAIYESMPIPRVTKSADQPVMKATRAELEIDKKARAFMRRNKGTTYPRAISAVMTSDPSLYTNYEKEQAAGNMVDVPATQFIDIPHLGKQSLNASYDAGDAGDTGDTEDTEDGEDESDLACSSCGNDDVSDDDKFCAACGKAL